MYRRVILGVTAAAAVVLAGVTGAGAASAATTPDTMIQTIPVRWAPDGAPVTVSPSVIAPPQTEIYSKWLTVKKGTTVVASGTSVRLGVGTYTATTTAKFRYFWYSPTKVTTKRTEPAGYLWANCVATGVTADPYGYGYEDVTWKCTRYDRTTTYTETTYGDYYDVAATLSDYVDFPPWTHPVTKTVNVKKYGNVYTRTKAQTLSVRYYNRPCATMAEYAKIRDNQTRGTVASIFGTYGTLDTDTMSDYGTDHYRWYDYQSCSTNGQVSVGFVNDRVFSWSAMW